MGSFQGHPGRYLLPLGIVADKHRRLFTYTNTTDKHPEPPLPASSWQWRGGAISHPSEPPPRWGWPSSFCPSSFAMGLRLKKVHNSDFTFFLWVWLWHLDMTSLWHALVYDTIDPVISERFSSFPALCLFILFIYFTFLTLKILCIFGLAVSLLLHMASLAAAGKPLTAVVSLISELGLQALRLRQLWLTGSGTQAQ